MTAETLKPFITPTSVEEYVTTRSNTAASRQYRSCYFLAIAASVITVILTIALLSTTIWNMMRISDLQTEVQSLNRVIDSMQKRLGLTYLDDLNDLEKEMENNNSLIDDILPDTNVDEDGDGGDNDNENISVDEDGDDNDDDDDYEEYEELMNKFRQYQETEDDEEESDNIDSVGDDNLYDDFEKYTDSKKKHQGERKSRSVAIETDEKENFEDNSYNERQTILRSFKNSHLKSIVTRDNYERRPSHLRGHNSRRRKYPIVKSGDSLISAKSIAPVTSIPIEVKPAAHFHFTHKVPYHTHELQISNHRGDIYIGVPGSKNELNADNFFQIKNGVLTIHEPGLYYVYAQICYHNDFQRNGFIVFHGRSIFLECLKYLPKSNVSLINTCYTSGLIYLQHDEHLHIRDIHSNRVTFLDDKSSRSFFGLFKI